MDDLYKSVSCHADEVQDVVSSLTTIAITTFKRFGFDPNFKAGKTEASIIFACPAARAAKKRLLIDQDGIVHVHVDVCGDGGAATLSPLIKRRFAASAGHTGGCCLMLPLGMT
eukprot:1567167-Karenia_brevis.AAC.1